MSQSATSARGVGSRAATVPPVPAGGDRRAMATTSTEPTSTEPNEPAGRLRRGKTLAERRHDRHEAILDAALDLFGTKGYTSTTVEEICRAAYVSTRNFYEEFANREAVLIALSERIAMQALDALMSIEADPGPQISEPQTRARVSAILQVLVADPRVARFVFIESLGVSPEQELRRRRIHRMIASWLADSTVEDPRASTSAEHQSLRALAVVGACNELISDW